MNINPSKPMPRRLKIAFVVHDYNRFGGHARYVAELASRFKHQHEIHIYANTFEEPDPTGLKYTHIPAWRRNALTTILSFIVPGTLAVRGKYDIIHAQGLCGLRHDIATAHFCQPGWYEALRRANGRLTWKEKISSNVITPLERLALSSLKAKRVIAVSDSVRRDLATYYHRRSGVTAIYHGVDLERFHPANRAIYRGPLRAELGIGENECMALFVGNLQKGAAAALRALAHVPGVKLVLVSGSNTTGDQAVAREAGVTDRAIFRPLSREVQKYFAAADVFVFPTIYEPYGMVIAEAMAAGVPTLTSRCAGAADLIEHGRTGWLVDPPWNIPAIAEGLGRLANDPSLCAEMGAAARRTIEVYTWDIVAERTMGVYQELLEARGNG